jgi:hypothetical protein
VFWSVASGVNVITSGTPMTYTEESDYLRSEVSRIAELLHIDDESAGKMGRFVRSVRMEAREHQ